MVSTVRILDLLTCRTWSSVACDVTTVYSFCTICAKTFKLEIKHGIKLNKNTVSRWRPISTSVILYGLSLRRLQIFKPMPTKLLNCSGGTGSRKQETGGREVERRRADSDLYTWVTEWETRHTDQTCTEKKIHFITLEKKYCCLFI